MFLRILILLSVGLFTVVQIANAMESTKDSGHQDLSFYLGTDGSHVPIRTTVDWEKRRAQIIAGMEEVMGQLPRPTSPIPLDVQVLEEHQEDGYIRRKIAYHTDDANSRVRAWLLIPTAPKRLPAVLCLHQTIKNGKDSVVGLADRPTMHYAKELAQRGYVALAPDYPSFGENKSYDFKKSAYASGTMKAIYDNQRAIDLLQTLPEVDGERIGCIGHSLGGHNTLFTAVFDARIRAAVSCCGFTSFHKYQGGDLRGWASSRYMPLVVSKFNASADQMSFDFAEVIAAIAPRAVFVVAPLHDDNFDVEGVRETLKASQSIYQLLGQPDRLQAVYPDSKHDFPDVERKAAYEFLDRNLGNKDLTPRR